MEAVNTVEGIIYGFKHILYGIGVVLIGLVFVGIGFGFITGGAGRGNVVGALLFVLIGASVILAGMFGVSYKVIADAVATGNHRALQARESSDQSASKVAKKIEDSQ